MTIFARNAIPARRSGRTRRRRSTNGTMTASTRTSWSNSNRRQSRRWSTSTATASPMCSIAATARCCTPTSTSTVNWAEKIDMKTGPSGQGAGAFAVQDRRAVQAWPSAMGGKDQQPCATDPNDPKNLLCARPTTGAWKTNRRTRSHTSRHRVRVRQRLHESGETRRDRQVQEVQRDDRQDRVGHSREVSRTGAARW